MPTPWLSKPGLRRVRDGLRSVSGDHIREPHYLRKRLSLEKRPVAAEKAKPQAGRHAVAPAAPNYVEPGGHRVQQSEPPRSPVLSKLVNIGRRLDHQALPKLIDKRCPKK